MSNISCINLIDYSKGHHSFSRLNVYMPTFIAITSPFTPYLLCFGVIFENFDPLHFVFDEVLPDPMYRDLSTIYICILIRFTSCLIAAVELCRSAAFGLICFFIVLDRVRFYMQLLIQHVRNGSVFIYYYNQARINYISSKAWVECIMYVTLFGMFWTSVSLSWICVRRSPSQISTPVYAFVVIFFGILVFAHIVVIPIGCEVAEMMVYVVEVHKLKAEVSLTKRKCFEGKLVIKQVHAIMPIRLWFGPYWCLGEEFVPEYLFLLFLRCFDAIMVY